MRARSLPSTKIQRRRSLRSRISAWSGISLRLFRSSKHFSRLELRQYVLGGGDLEFAWRLDEHGPRPPVIDDNRETLPAHSEAEASAIHLESQGPGVVAIAVGKHED